jgi:hypothetical protein
MTAEDPAPAHDSQAPGGPMEESGIGVANGLEHDPSPPSGKKWLYYLFCRPRRFFTHFVVEPVPKLTALACYVFGLANVIDRVETRTTEAELSGRSNPFAVAAGSWPTFWTFCVSVAVVSAVMIYWVGGWWYLRRLSLCGARQPDKALSQRVYVFASLVWALPAVAYTLWEAGVYESPQAAMNAEDMGGLIVIGFLFWSLVTSYHGVVTAFTVRRGLALLWFVVLPGVFYVVILSSVVIAMFAVGESGVRANTAAPQTHSRASFRFSYPGNWTINKAAGSYDPDGDLTILAPYADCAVCLHIAEAGDEAVTLANYRQHHEKEFHVQTWQPVTEWGRFSGVGATGTGESEGKNYRIHLFVAKQKDRLLIVQELCHAAALENMQPGFELIRRSFRWR